MDSWSFILYISVMITVSVSPSKDDPAEFWSAKIFGSSTAKAGGDIPFKCAIFHKSRSNKHVYLCKNGVGSRLKVLGDKDEHTFILRNVSVLDSGNYSCVYSFTKYAPDDVRASGYNTIQVQVMDILLVKSAVIRSGRTMVKKGEDIQLTCSISESEKPALLHVYICKDGLGKISGTVYNQTQTRFSIKGVNVEDSGVYSCVYSAEQYVISEVTDTERENSILIQVYDPQWQINLIRLLSSLGVVVFACLIVVFDVYTTKRRFSESCNQSEFTF